jgi:hypothetical protein
LLFLKELWNYLVIKELSKYHISLDVK